MFAADHGFIVSDDIEHSPKQTEHMVSRFIAGHFYLHGLVAGSAEHSIELTDVGLISAPLAVQKCQVASIA